MPEKTSSNTSILYWLYACCFMVFAMAIIGAITRLTESGLSIVEWNPVMGALPPFNEAEWQRNFDLYKQTSEFKYQHSWMELSDFKTIFFWEWFHRLWGRLIGLVFAIPLVWFWARNKVPHGYKPRLVGLLLLGGAQGAIGYWMVVSGFVDRTDVSHYRLAIHLSIALLIFGLLWWTALDIKAADTKPNQNEKLYAHNHTTKTWAWLCLGLLSVTIIWGAFVAGLNAGQIYNSFPMMGKSLIPQEQFDISSIIDQHGWVQFFHRWIAVITGLFIIGFSVRVRALFLGAMVFIQIGLGISTLLTQVALPLATAHQAGAIILLALLINECHKIKNKAEKLRD